MAASDLTTGDVQIANVVIAHISDLHFGARGQDETWNQLKTHLVDEVKPQLILVTGDIVNTPRKKHLNKAWTELEDLRTKLEGTSYFVCQGNHDSFFYGNRLASVRWILTPFRWLAKGVRRLTKSTAQSNLSRFSAKFGDRVPEAGQGKNLTVGKPPNEWKLRILALNSSAETDRFARGIVRYQDVQNLGPAMAGSQDVDLALLLVHHHLLSVRALEEGRRKKRWDLLNVTTLVNSGTLLEKLASAHVDVALHGHEHESNWGRYGTLESKGGETAVVAAGSATGAVTLRKCDQSNATYNLVELKTDRTVSLRIRPWVAGWTPGTVYQLLDSQSLRRSKFLRRSADLLERPPTSEITKYMEFTRARDGIVTETRHDWRFDRHQNKWSLDVSNDTGEPDGLEVQFIPDDGHPWNPKDHPCQFEEVKSNPNEPRRYHYECEVSADRILQSHTINICYIWSGGLC